MAERLYLIRHGAIAAAGDKCYWGRTNRALTAEGVSQAQALARLLPADEIDLAVCSPLQRARETAELAGFPQAAIWDDLREIDFGEWEGRTFDEIAAAAPKLVQQWHDDDPAFGFPGGERLVDFRERVCETGRRLAGLPEKHVAVFAHGGVVRTLLCHFLDLPLDRYLLFTVSPATVATVRLFGEHGLLQELISASEVSRRWDTSSS